MSGRALRDIRSRVEEVIELVTQRLTAAAGAGPLSQAAVRAIVRQVVAEVRLRQGPAPRDRRFLLAMRLWRRWRGGAWWNGW
ncbi:hypothetical protein [Carbonactinospora thermoautotrophica]|uniref:hypothetical protein n=1 Tax=Carbonactinospora thermoautotrophica TaxID=1469144 RepID=UPI00082E3F87|nr:hypothetical protein [Carbonactinospora thermoautotrophica]